MRRRAVLATGGSVLAGLGAGCLESFRREDAWRELVVDPPDGVYVPPHADGMVGYGTATAEGRAVSLLASRPHSFWLVAGTERERADIRSRHDLHLMVVVRDAETGTVVPAPVTTTVRPRDASDGDAGDDPVDRRSLWPMLSQRMGAHYGDNVSLAGDGPYTATVRIGAPIADGPASDADESAGDADEREDGTRVDIDFAYDAAEIEGLERRLIDADEGRGAGNALEPMDHAASGQVDRHLESAAVLGTATSEDIDYGVLHLTEDRTDTADSLLAVTARTPYNAYPLPFASLSATIGRDGATLATAPLRETIDRRVGHCYAAPADPTVLDDGDELTVALETPPQVARHEGYETAFLESETVTVSLDGS